MTTQQENKIREEFNQFLNTDQDVGFLSGSCQVKYGEVAWEDMMESITDFFLARFREMEGEEEPKNHFNGCCGGRLESCKCICHKKPKTELSQCCGAISKNVRDRTPIGEGSSRFIMTGVHEECSKCGEPFRAQYDRCECKNCMDIDLNDRCEKGCDDIDCKPFIPRQEKECKYCKRNHGDFACREYINSLIKDNKEPWWGEELQSLGNFVCNCKVYDDGECPRFNRIKSFIRQVEERARKQGRREAVEALEKARDDDSCECDNCNRTRKFIKANL